MTETIGHVYPHVIAAIVGRPWAIHEATMSTILNIMDMRADGMRLSAGEVQDRLAAARDNNGPRSGPQRQKRVAVVPLYGVITPRAGGLASSGASSVESFRDDFRAALNDDDIDAIVLDVDSPGGVVDGLPEMYQEIFESRGIKPITAVSNTQMASGALWLGAAADRIVASPSASVGSIGVIGVHKDKSEQYAKAGIKHTIIKTSPFKGEGHDAAPLTEDAAAYMLAEAQEYDDMFTDAVAQGRGTTMETVRADFGQGRMLSAKNALAAGLIDGIETLEQAVRSTAAISRGEGKLAATSRQTSFAAETAVLSTHEQTEGQATDLPFADRLQLATVELEAVVGIARDRATRRADDGRPLSAATREHLGRMAAALAELETVTPAEPQAARVASGLQAELMLKLHEYQEGTR